MSSLLAERAFRSGDWAAAERLCDEALLDSPEDVLALRVKGMTLIRMGRPEEAITYFKQVLSYEPNDFASLEWLQGALMQTGRFGEAVEFGERARALRPRDANILIGLSQACYKSGAYLRAVHYLESARGLDGGNASIHHLLGLAYEKIKRNRDALASFREAIRLNLRLGDAYDRVARILLEEGRFPAAYRLCEQAFATAPKYGPIHLRAAQALWALGRPDEGEEHARRAVDLDSSLTWTVATWLQSCAAPSRL